jgi:hypothetical protein
LIFFPISSSPFQKKTKEEGERSKRDEEEEDKFKGLSSFSIPGFTSD